MNSSLAHLLKSKRGKRIVFVGVGNTLRGDDGTGVEFIRSIENKTDVLCINAGTVPENYLGDIRKSHPDFILFIDAMELHMRPGEYMITSPDTLGWSGFSTHTVSLTMLSEILTLQTGAEVLVLGIQPEQRTVGSGISTPVRETLLELTNSVCTALC